MIGVTSLSFVCGINRPGRRMTDYQEAGCSRDQRMAAATGNERRTTVRMRWAQTMTTRQISTTN